MSDDVTEPKKTKEPKIEKPVYPAAIKMTKPFGFITDEGDHHYWMQGMLVDVPEQIAEIIDHKCTDFIVE